MVFLFMSGKLLFPKGLNSGWVRVCSLLAVFNIYMCGYSVYFEVVFLFFFGA